MPVAIGNELKLQDNKVSAEYGELFRKLNVAKAWTNTTTTESGGTVTVLNGDGNVITNIECGYNDWCATKYTNGGSQTCVISGKLYRVYNGSMNQIGDKTDWLCCSSIKYNNTSMEYLHAIDKTNKLYYFSQVTTSGTYNSMTEIGSGIKWTNLSCDENTGVGIGDDKIYKITSTTVEQIGQEIGWTKLSSLYSNTMIGLCNGYVYWIDINNKTTTLMNANNNFVDISSGYPYVGSISCAFALNTFGELYYKPANQTTLSKFDFDSKIIQISDGTFRQADISFITEDNKLYYSISSSSELSNNYIYELGSGIHWTYTLSGYDNHRILAIGDGKLYKIVPNTSGGELTQIGTTTGYKKVDGDIYTITQNSIALAWTGNATHTETTVYTTQNPIANDKAYSDTNLTEYSTVQSCTGSTITDNYRTYQADIAKNSSFTKIPPATIHETVKAIDILRATE